MFPFRCVHLNIASTQLQVMPPVLLDAIWTKTNNVSSQTHVIYIKTELCKVYYQSKNPKSLLYNASVVTNQATVVSLQCALMV